MISDEHIERIESERQKINLDYDPVSLLKLKMKIFKIL